MGSFDSSNENSPIGHEELASRQHQHSIDATTACHPEKDALQIDPESVKRVIEYLREVIDETEDAMIDDPNYPSSVLLTAAKALKPGVPAEEIFEIAEATRAGLRQGEENSPYPEVRACVDAFDDPTLPVLTFRTWVIGLVLAILEAAVNQFFLVRLPGLALSVTISQVVAYPIGCLMAKVLPTRVFHLGSRSFSLNPGPFNIKEHVLITIMVNASSARCYAVQTISVLRNARFYNNPGLGNNVGFQLTYVLSTQLMGYSLAGLTRSFLVYYREMVWWDTLPQIIVLKALHGKDNRRPVGGWKISPMRLFFYCAIGYGIYFILPGVFFQALSFFNWTTWFAPNNVKLAIITGTVSGLGLNPIPTLDWNFMMRDPIVAPLWATINLFIGALIALVAICVIYFKNILFTAYLPINGNQVFDRTGRPYNVSRVLDEVGAFDRAKYEAYSPPFMTAARIVCYTGFFALHASVIVHTVLYYSKFAKRAIFHYMSSWRAPFGKVKNTTKSTIEESYRTDVHYRLMQAYPEVPMTWYLLVGIISMTLAVFMIECYQTHLAIWGLGLCILISVVFLIPLGILQGIVSINAPINVLSELVGGYAFAGRPLSNMIFKTYGTNTVMQALNLTSDMKLAHYMKVPQKAVFVAQLVATILASCVSPAVLDWQLLHFPDLCERDQPSHMVCPAEHVFYSASILYGAVGPSRLFTQDGALYQCCLYGFAGGVMLPFIPWLATKRWPRSSWRFVHAPVVISGCFFFFGANLAYITPTVLLGLFFQGYLKRRHIAWYEQYAMPLAAGLGAGTAVAGLIYFFAFQMNGNTYEWAGNTIYRSGCDGEGCTLLKVPEHGFGPDTWR